MVSLMDVLGSSKGESRASHAVIERVDLAMAIALMMIGQLCLNTLSFQLHFSRTAEFKVSTCSSASISTWEVALSRRSSSATIGLTDLVFRYLIIALTQTKRQ